MSHPYISTRADGPEHTIWFETRPRHLAGGGDPRHITQALRAAGWKNHSDPDYPHVVLASPDHRHTVVLEPETSSYTAWWRIQAHGDHDHWYTTFGGNTPVEILAGLTDALLKPVPKTAPDIWAPLTQAGWTYERDEHRNESARHPDNILSLRRRAVEPGEDFSWTAEATLPTGLGGHKRIWHAYFNDRMPPHLIAAFTHALARDEPVQRRHYDVPHSHLVTQERGPRGERLAHAHEARLKTVRATARKTRRTALAAQKPSAPSTAPAAPARSR
ncbi:DUF317 domain-containing protein [Streptomyces niveus]|uniref:DUF317 domain-containing protein n=1 Tax=Streptomyces niveus TaxID=193462 RepID=A0A1U9QKW2_STRNV|nr:DUF317 domain-containing protein [Streptomyces niveus]AQU64902.1 hypothetical protein BBN63_00060 [Streptomyces niveus]